ncbi:peptidase U32 family protein [Bacillus kwashiorkori]|uniref:peptidase U32 family protein n=1 Tax=Bacillus kwashiorkori TaxID=1522318 RepID=UPI00078314DE|nr:peptidase U32 family protein [Bacillus kwashiorkori]
MFKPELLLTPTKLSDLEPLINAGADAFVIGEQQFGLRLAGEFTRGDVLKAVDIIHSHNKKVYVAVNAIFHNEKLDDVTDYMQFLQTANVDGVLFGDPAVLMIARDVAPKLKLHWNPETTATNWFQCNYWGKRRALRSVLSRELSMDEIIEIKENTDVEIEVQVHGMTCMFQSKRKLVGNYFEFRKEQMELKHDDNQQLFLYDAERDNKYPIFEDVNGTHIMSPNDICIIDELEELIDANIDSFKIEGVLKTTDYLVTVTKLYRNAIDLAVENRKQYNKVKADLVKQIEEVQPVNRPLDTGFFYKETVY